MKQYIKPFILPVMYLIIMPIITSIINLFGITLPSFIYMIISSIIMFISGFLIARQINKKILMHAVLYSIIIVLLSLILSLILKSNINMHTLLYYTIITLSTILGSMFYTLKKDN